jgi:hypothetical protein
MFPNICSINEHGDEKNLDLQVELLSASLSTLLHSVNYRPMFMTTAQFMRACNTM